MTRTLDQLLEANAAFLARTPATEYRGGKTPRRRIVIVTCIDTRLVGLLEPALGIDRGDAKIVKIAGAQVRHPFGSAMHSVLIAIHFLDADEVVVIAHHDCGMQRVGRAGFIEQMQRRGISAETIRVVERSGIDLDRFMQPFDSVYDSVRASVSLIAEHPFVAGARIPVHGLVIDPGTGRLERVVDGCAALGSGEDPAARRPPAGR